MLAVYIFLFNEILMKKLITLTNFQSVQVFSSHLGWKVPRNCFVSLTFICLDVEIDVDDRQLVVHMKQWLSAVIGIDMNEFVVLKHYSADDADGYESINNETETIHDAYYGVQKVWYQSVFDLVFMHGQSDLYDFDIIIIVICHNFTLFRQIFL